MEDEVELHRPGGMEVEKEYDFEQQPTSRWQKLRERISEIQKPKILQNCTCKCRCKLPKINTKLLLILLAILILFLTLALLISSAAFGVGFGIGWAIESGATGDVDYDYQDYPYVHRSPSDVQLDKKDPIQSIMYESNEYQFKLSVSPFTKDRMTGVRQLLILVEQVLNITIDHKDEDRGVFIETQYSSSDCGTSYSELRIRNYIGGELDQSSESDINKDGDPHSSKSNAMSYDITPADKYLNDCEMKIEQDVHPCWYKFNKKTKVKDLPANFEFKTCGDVLDLYPHSFKGANAKKSIGKKSTTYFWEYKYKGHMQGGQTKFKLSFNLAYKTLEAALEGTNIAPTAGESEFSIRMYSTDDGLGPWNYQLLAEMGENYQFLLDTYGSTDYPCK